MDPDTRRFLDAKIFNTNRSDVFEGILGYWDLPPLWLKVAQRRADNIVQFRRTQLCQTSKKQFSSVSSLTSQKFKNRRVSRFDSINSTKVDQHAFFPFDSRSHRPEENISRGISANKRIETLIPLLVCFPKVNFNCLQTNDSVWQCSWTKVNSFNYL